MEIRPAASAPELHACVDLQMEVWGFDPRDVVPFNQLHTAHEWGGQVLVAVERGEVVGFCYGFAGRQNGAPALLSHMLAVRGEYRGQGLGMALKVAQGRWAREQGYGLVTWTYDPLEAVNANLNIARLGGVVRRYLVNHYGEMTGTLNGALPTDRLLVEWRVTDPAVAAVLDGQDRGPSGPAELTCVIPQRFQQIKATSPAEALRWRLQVRQALQDAFKAGYLITGFVLQDGTGSYLLTRGG